MGGSLGAALLAAAAPVQQGELSGPGLGAGSHLDCLLPPQVSSGAPGSRRVVPEDGQSSSVSVKYKL